MRFHFNLSNHTRDRLGDLAVMAMIAVAVIASYGCGSESPARDVVAEDVNSTPRYTYETVAQTEFVPAVAPEVEPIVAQPVERVPVTYAVAEQAYRDGRFLEAVELFEGYVDSKPENPWGLYMLGLSARMTGDVDRSVAAFERSIEIDPHHMKSHLNLARVLISADRLDEASEHVDDALSINPESGDAFRLLGRISTEMGDVEGAMDAYERALTINEWDAWSMNNLGLLHLTRGEYDRALLPLARATELNADVAVFQNNLGMALERSGYFELAFTAYERAVVADPTHQRALANRNRIEGRRDNPNLEPIELEVLAQDFAAEIISWRNGLADVPPIEPIEVDIADQTPPSTATDSTIGPVNPDTTRSMGN